MIHTWFINAAEILVLSFMFILTLTWLKRLLVNGSATIGRGTWEDETLNVQVEFRAWDTKKSMARKLQRAYDLNGDRRAHWVQYQKEVFENAQRDKEEEVNNKKKLKALGG